ncbi:MAG TPA: hypothetical protein VGR57_03150 [Ktedonobacterales bacterium]|nr:hypothetical protein [Ktedonobacterales bacterium]
MFWLIAVQWLHVLGGILWFGGSMYITLILIPALLPLPREKQQEVAARVSPLTTRVLMPVGLLVIALGFIRGTFLGRLHSVQDVFGSAYGLTWLVGLVAAIALFTFIAVIFDPDVRRLNAAKSSVEYGATLARVKVLAVVELLGFFAIFTCMILMRFGY